MNFNNVIAVSRPLGIIRFEVGEDHDMWDFENHPRTVVLRANDVAILQILRKAVDPIQELRVGPA